MGLQDYRKKRLVDAIVNKTSDLVCMYAQGTGSLIRAFPDKRPFPEYDPDSKYFPDGRVMCFIVTPEQFKQIRIDFPDRQLDDIGILLDPPSPGRDGMPVGKIFWAKDPEIEVVFYPNVIDCLMPHL